jgi:hypothetical protein
VPVIDRLLGHENDWVQLHTILALRHVVDEIDETVVDMGPVKQQVRAAAESGNNYVRRVAQHMLETRGWPQE